jgi:uncharacterized membrane protein
MANKIEFKQDEQWKAFFIGSIWGFLIGVLFAIVIYILWSGLR